MCVNIGDCLIVDGDVVNILVLFLFDIVSLICCELFIVILMLYLLFVIWSFVFLIVGGVDIGLMFVLVDRWDNDGWGWLGWMVVWGVRNSFMWCLIGFLLYLYFML